MLPTKKTLANSRSPNVQYLSHHTVTCGMPRRHSRTTRKGCKRQVSRRKKSRTTRRKKGGFSIRNSRLGKYSRHQLKRLPKLTEAFCRTEVQKSNKGNDKIKGILNRRRHSLLKRGCYEKFPHVRDIGFRHPYLISKDVYETYRPFDESSYLTPRKLSLITEPSQGPANSSYRYPDADAVMSQVRSKTSSQGTIQFMEFALNNFKRPLDETFEKEIRSKWNNVSFWHARYLKKYDDVPDDVKNSALFRFIRHSL